MRFKARPAKERQTFIDIVNARRVKITDPDRIEAQAALEWEKAAGPAGRGKQP